MKLTLTPVRVYEVRGGNGATGLYAVAAEWEGLVKLREIGGSNVLILSPDTARSFLGVVFEEHATEATVIRASPDFLSHHPCEATHV